MRPGHLDLELRIPLSLAFCLHGPKYLGSPRLVGDTAFNDIIPGPKAETARKAGQRPARIRGGHTLRDSLDCGLCWAKEGILTSWHVVLSPVVTRAKLHSPPAWVAVCTTCSAVTPTIRPSTQAGSPVNGRDPHNVASLGPGGGPCEPHVGHWWGAPSPGLVQVAGRAPGKAAAWAAALPPSHLQ